MSKLTTEYFFAKQLLKFVLGLLFRHLLNLHCFDYNFFILSLFGPSDFCKLLLIVWSIGVIHIFEKVELRVLRVVLQD